MRGAPQGRAQTPEMKSEERRVKGEKQTTADAAHHAADADDVTQVAKPARL
jgi:hypothetical protein